MRLVKKEGICYCYVRTLCTILLYQCVSEDSSTACFYLPHRAPPLERGRSMEFLAPFMMIKASSGCHDKLKTSILTGSLYAIAPRE